MSETNRRMLDLDDLPRKKDAPDLVLAFDANGLQCDLSSEERVDILEFWMRPLTGKDDRDLLNHQIRRGRKGMPRFAPVGDNAAMRLRKAVTEVRGLCVGGEPVTKITAEVYDKLPGWVIAALRKRMKEINGLDDDELDDDEEDLAGE